MKRLVLRLVVLVILTALPGCSKVTKVERTVISGAVSLPNGALVARAKVVADSGESTFTDDRGEYRLVLNRRETGVTARVTLRASDGFDPRYAYAVTHSGRVEVPLLTGHVVQHIVLDESTPI